MSLAARASHIVSRCLPSRSFESYEAAAASSDAYENPELVRAVVEKNVRHRDGLDGQISLADLRTIAGVGWACTDAGIRVLDFGGGGGHHYTVARPVLRGPVSWAVAETAAMAREAKRMANAELKFHDSVEAARASLGAVDLVFTSGALQYCPDPLDALGRLVDVGADRMFITRTALAEGREVYLSQRSRLSENGPGPLPPGFQDAAVSYPVSIARRDKFEAVLSSRYQILLTVLEERAAYRDKSVDMLGYFCRRRR